MSQISLKSISGITSITTPAGVDNQLTVHTNDTTEVMKVTSSGLNVTGVVTATTFSGNVSSPSADIDDFISVGSNIHLGNAGIITATSFRGDGSQLSGVVQSDTPAGSSTSSSIFFEVDTGVSISTTTTLSRTSSNPGRIFTKVKEIVVGTSSPSSVELIVAANEQLVVDYFDVIT